MARGCVRARPPPYADWVRTFPYLLAGALIFAACTAQSPSVTTLPPPTTSSTSTPATSTASTSATLPVDTTSPSEDCPEGDVMVADGQLLDFDRPGSDATRIAGITWRTTGTCQIVSISFATEDGAPATTPPTMTARVLRSAGVLRISTTTPSSVIVDQLVEDGQVDRLFVPVDAAGSRFIDLVLNGPTVARARVLTSPARLELDLQPGGPEEIGRPLMSSELVVVEPGSAAVAEPVLDVSGYSTGGLEQVNLKVLLEESTVTETTLTLESNTGVWTEFSLAIPVGERPYDSLQVSIEDDSVVAGIPFSP